MIVKTVTLFILIPIAAVVGYSCGWMSLQALLTIPISIYWVAALLFGYGIVYYIFQFLRNKDRIEDLSENVALSAIFMIGTLTVVPFGVYSAWKAQHINLYIDNGFEKQTTFNIKDVGELTIRSKKYESIEVPIMPIEIDFNNKKVSIPIDNHESWIFNTDTLNDYFEHKVKYVDLIGAVINDKNKDAQDDSDLKVITHQLYFSTKAKLILTEPSHIIRGASGMEYLVLERIEKPEK
jgi:hypothetical protein